MGRLRGTRSRLLFEGQSGHRGSRALPRRLPVTVTRRLATHLPTGLATDQCTVAISVEGPLAVKIQVLSMYCLDALSDHPPRPKALALLSLRFAITSPGSQWRALRAVITTSVLPKGVMR